MRGIRRTLGRLILGAVFALTVAACSSGTAAPTVTAESPSTTSTASSQPLTSTVPPTTTTSTEATTTTSAPAQATCDHPYFPARTGASWTYENLDGDIALWEITSISEDGSVAVMEADLASPEGIVRATVNLACDESGISAPELAFIGLPLGAEVTQVTEDGVFLLPADQLVAGATWTSVVEISAELPGDVVFEIERTANYTVLGPDEVTVPAGTFNALMIQSEYMLNIDAAGRTIKTESEEVLWYAEGIGLVREASDEGEQAAFGNSLVSYFVP